MPAFFNVHHNDVLPPNHRCLDVSDGAAYGGVTGVEVGHFGELRDHFVRQVKKEKHAGARLGCSRF